jgi:hypothetical protein
VQKISVQRLEYGGNRAIDEGISCHFCSFEISPSIVPRDRFLMRDTPRPESQIGNRQSEIDNLFGVHQLSAIDLDGFSR